MGTVAIVIAGWVFVFPVTFVGLLALSRWRANQRDKADVARRIAPKVAA